MNIIKHFIIIIYFVFPFEVLSSTLIQNFPICPSHCTSRIDSVTYDFEDGDLSIFNAEGGSISITDETGPSGNKSLYMQHYAGQVPHNFYAKELTVGYGTFTIFGKTSGSISNLKIYLYGNDNSSTEYGIYISLRPNGSDNPGISITGNGFDTSSAANFNVNEWVKIEIQVLPNSFSLKVKEDIVYEENREIVISEGRFKVGAVFLGYYDSITYDRYITNSDSHPIVEFSLPISVSDALPNVIDLIVGTDSSATSGFDMDTDRLAPPSPPSGSFDARIKVDGQSYFTFYQPSTVEKTEWTLEFAPETGYAPITLSWDTASLPLEGRMTLTDVIDGSFVNVDMSEQNSLTIEESFITQLTLTHQLTVDVTETYRANWDLVGLPVEFEHEGFAELFPSSNANTLYGYDGTYSQAQTLTAGKGYWLNFAEQNEVTLTGFPIREMDLDLRINWNLISGLSESSMVVDEGGILLPGSLYGYDGFYNEPTTLEPGNGYWIATLEAGSVSLVSADSVMSVASGLVTNGNSFGNPRQDEAMLSQAMMIEFELDEASLLPLFAGATIGVQYHPLQLSLPPVPPAGSVDARFENSRWITEDSQVQIQLQQNEEPLYMVVRSSATSMAGVDVTQESQTEGISTGGNEEVSPPSKGVEILFMDEGREMSSITAVYEERIQVPNQADQLMITPSSDIIEQELPNQFALEQNYPNPFNPSTSIEYALPEVTDVRLEVFNILGQRVATLVDAKQQAAGLYEVIFKASDLSSGMYVYRLAAGGFVQTRKMVLTK